MKKIISVLLCVIVILGAFSFSSVDAKDKKAEKETEFVLEIDVNERYTNFVEDTDGLVDSTIPKKEMSESQKTVYIAILVAALVVSIVILAVSVKRVPKEEDIDISGKKKIKNDEENKE